MVSNEPLIKEKIDEAYILFDHWFNPFLSEWEESFDPKNCKLFCQKQNGLKTVFYSLHRLERKFYELEHSHRDREIFQQHLNLIYETILKLVLHIFARIPRLQISDFLVFTHPVSEYLSRTHYKIPQLFQYFVKEFRSLLLDLMSSSSKFPRELDFFESRKLSLNTCASKNIGFDKIKLLSFDQVESLLVTSCYILNSIGKPVVSALTMPVYCEFLWTFLRASTRHSISVMCTSMNLFVRHYPIKCIKLNPREGFFDLLIKLTCMQNGQRTHQDLLKSVSCGWSVVLCRLKLEKQRLTCKPLELMRFFISLVNALSASSFWIASPMFNLTLPEIFATLFHLMKTHHLNVSNDDICFVFNLYKQRLIEFLSFDSKWASVMRLFLLPLDSQDLEISGGADLSLDRVIQDADSQEYSNVVDSQPQISSLKDSTEMIDLLSNDCHLAIFSFLKQYETYSYRKLHNLLSLEWELVMAARIGNTSAVNIKQIHQIVKIADKICSILESPLVAVTGDELIAYFHLLVLVIKTNHSISLRDYPKVQERIPPLLFIPFDNQPASLSNRDFWSEFRRHLTLEQSKTLCRLAVEALALLHSVPDFKLKTDLIIDAIYWLDERHFWPIWSFFMADCSVSLIEKNIPSFLSRPSTSAKIIGLIACCVSNARKQFKFGFEPTFNSAQLILECSVCDKHEYINYSEGSDKILDKLTDTFEQLITTKTHLKELSKWSASRIFNHCRLKKSTLHAIFSLVGQTDSVSTACLRNTFIPLLTAARKNSYQNICTELNIIQVLVESSNHITTDTKRSSVEIENLILMGHYCDDIYELIEILVLICKKFRDENSRECVRDKIRSLLERHGLDVDTFFKHFSRMFCLRLAENSLECISTLQASGLTMMRSSLLLFFERIDDKWIVSEMIDCLFTSAVGRADETGQAMVTELISDISLDSRDLVKSYTTGLARVLVGLPTLDRVCKSLEFLNKQAGGEISFESLYLLLEMVLLESYQNVQTVGFIVAKILAEQSCSQNRDNYFTEKVRKTIEFEFGGFLILFNHELTAHLKDVRQRCLYLKGFRQLLAEDILGPEIASKYKLNIIGTLVTAYSNTPDSSSEYLKELFHAWSNFLQLCNPSELGPHLPVVCKELLPFFEIYPEETTNVLTNLIIENEQELKDYFKHLHFLPKESLKQIWGIIDGSFHILFRLDQSNLTQSLRQVMEIMAEELLIIDNPDVKIKHLDRLKIILDTYNTQLHDLRLPRKEGTADSSVIMLVRKLLGDSALGIPSLSSHIAGCLGEIGAIDPGRLDLSLLSSNKNSSKEITLIDEENIPVELLIKLASTLESVQEARVRDSLCYAIQECLRQFDVKEDDELWQKLPVHVQMSVKQYFSTKYIIKSPRQKDRASGDVFEESSILLSQGTNTDTDTPIFHEDIQYETWIHQWTLRLIDLIQKETLRCVLNCCETPMKYSVDLCRFVLKLVFWIAFDELDNETIDKVIVSEINTILYAGSEKKVYLSSTQHPLTSQFEKLSIVKEEHEGVRFRCARTIFSLLDYANFWESSIFLKACDIYNSKTIEAVDNTEFYSDSCRAKAIREARAAKEAKDTMMKETRRKLVQRFQNISKSDLAEIAYECQAYTRALKYMEEYIEENPDSLEKKLEFLQKYYVALSEPDAVEGFNILRSRNPSLKDTILYHEANNQLQYSLSCCEIAIIQDPADIIPYKALLGSLINLGQQNTALNYSRSLSYFKKNWRRDIYPYMLESSVKLNDWTELGTLIKKDDVIDCFEVGLAHLFDCIHRGDEKSLAGIFKNLRQQEMDYLAASPLEEGAYVRGYQHIVRLHMINDVEKFSQAYLGVKRPPSDSISQNSRNSQETSKIWHVLEQWQERNELIQPSFKYKDPVLVLQKSLLSFVENCDDLTRCKVLDKKCRLILSSAKLARKSQNLQLAYANLVQLQELLNSNSQLSDTLRYQLAIEKTKFEWSKGDQESKEKCIYTLEKTLDQLEGADKEQFYVKAKLRHIVLCENLTSLRSNELKERYFDLVTKHGDYEETNFAFAKFCDRLVANCSSTNYDPEKPSNMYTAAKHYGDSLKYGSKHFYESMPRLLDLWCDHGILNISDKKQASHDMFSKLVKKLLDQLPLYFFFSSLSQLLSRLCHSNATVNKLLEQILEKLLLTYPHQVMWNMIGIYLNKQEANRPRVEQCERIFTNARRRSPTMGGFLSDFIHLSNDLVKLADFRTNCRVFSLRDTSLLVNLFRRGDFSDIMLPYQDYLTARMRSKSDEDSSFSPFPSHPVYIKGFEETVKVYWTLAKPKKLGIKCSDGRTYYVMCKGNDDLRKDAKAIEFANLVNRLLNKHPDTRSRQLKIRTYTVIPLGQNKGLVEWLSDLSTMKDIIKAAWPINNPDVKFPLPVSENLNEFWKKSKSDAEAAKIYQSVVRRYKPSSQTWFSLKFPDPTSWHTARLLFTKSCAVSSIAGYIIGFGDRHLENINVNHVTGECIHVDLNQILFGGEELPVPERVPFRLTANMIAPMGCSKYEGVFRKTCEATLSVLRAKKEELLTVLLPLVFDYENEVMRTRARSAASPQLRDSRSKTAQKIKLIGTHLDGIVDLKSGMPVSVSGQVRYLIDEATNPVNLGHMFIGWSAFL